jgi:hypothetical protein
VAEMKAKNLDQRNIQSIQGLVSVVRYNSEQSPRNLDENSGSLDE